MNWVICQKRQPSVGERATYPTLRSSNIVGGREEATVAKETEGKRGRDIEGRQESVGGEAKVESVPAGRECPGALRASGHPALGDRRALTLRPHEIAVDFCGSHFSGAVGGSQAAWTEELGGAETMPASCV